ncbi:MAG: hypothetical protein MJZ24_08925 [Paludibacteraceae bacterium]|nr:hypothetical protein [Paludibacteraceae bacterium]
MFNGIFGRGRLAYCDNNRCFGALSLGKVRVKCCFYCEVSIAGLWQEANESNQTQFDQTLT